MKKTLNELLCEESGSIEYPSSDLLTNFLYELIRDHLPAGQVEGIVRKVELEPRNGNNLYSNGWLAQYANNIARRLR